VDTVSSPRPLADARQPLPSGSQAAEGRPEVGLLISEIPCNPQHLPLRQGVFPAKSLRIAGKMGLEGRISSSGGSTMKS